MTVQHPENLFDADYFAHGCGLPYQRSEQWLTFFGNIADQIVERIKPTTVLDAGCALGFLVESLRDRGVETYGLDISEYAIENVRADMQPYCRVGSVLESFGQQYDLITCIEVLEHMPQAESELAVKNLCQHTDDIIFSSSPVDYKEVTHFNVQPPEYWAELFAREGFYRDVDFDASFILPWTVRFRRKQEPPPRLIRDYERKFWLLAKENIDLRELTLEMRQQLAEAPSHAIHLDATEDFKWLQTQLQQRQQRPWLKKFGLFSQFGILGDRPVRRLPIFRQPLTQLFTAEHDRLTGVTLLVDTKYQLPTHPLQMTITQAESQAQPSCEVTVPVRKIPHYGPLTVRFPPLHTSKGQLYRLTMQLADQAGPDSVAFWRYLRPGRAGSRLFLGEESLGGELVMSALYGPPEEPFADLWTQSCWLPSSIYNLKALFGLLKSGLARS